MYILLPTARLPRPLRRLSGMTGGSAIVLGVCWA